ncbi:MAG: hypothetical protein AAF669_03465 [Pseudomonadota bacterium]
MKPCTVRTWIVFGASEQIWGTGLLPEVRRNLATIARIIACYESVSMLVRPDEVDAAYALVGLACAGEGVYGGGWIGHCDHYGELPTE